MSVIQILTLQTLETKNGGTRDAFFSQNGNDFVEVSGSLFQHVNVFPCVCGRISVLYLVHDGTECTFLTVAPNARGENGAGRPPRMTDGAEPEPRLFV